jgi:hypothetical protein
MKALQRTPAAFHAGLTPMHLLEASATNIQLYFINDVFGDKAFFEMINFIQGGQSSKLYLQIINEVLDLYYARGFRGQRLAVIINYLIWYSLFGTTFPDKKRSEGVSMITLYEALVEHVTRGARTMDFSEVRELVLGFCQQWGFLTPEQMVSRISDELSLNADRLEQAWKEREAHLTDEQRSESFGSNLVKDYRCLIEAYSRLNEWISKYPESYFGNYVWALILGELPRVRVFLKLNGSIYHTASPGYEIMSLDSWESITQLSTTLRLLVEGRSTKFLYFSFLEDICFNRLMTEDINGVRLKFADKSLFC